LIPLIVLSKKFNLIQTTNHANKEFLNSINTRQLDSLVYLIKKLALIKNETTTTSTKQVELVKYLVKKDVRVFFKANSMTISSIAYAPTTTKKTTKTTTSTITNNNNINNNIFPLISIEETNQTYVIIKVNKELLILVASVILLIFIVVIVLNNMSKCVNGSKNYYFRQYY